MSEPRRSSAAREQSEWQNDLQGDFEHELKSAVDSILQAYPKFRILILGRAGVGKSKLINAIFGTDFAAVEHGRRAGVSNIEKEITSEKNSRLILHDSQGFCHGSGDNFNVVKKFIETRSQMSDLKDRLHAIWLCSAVPTYGGSLLEVAEEEILKMKGCDVPIVAVFTKYDILVDSLKPPDDEDFYGDIEKEIEELDKEEDPNVDPTAGTSASQIDPNVLSCAKEKLCEMIAPFEEKLCVPWVEVSVKPELSGTLDGLVDVTQQRINNSLELLWAITQQRKVEPKVKASIDIGKKKYWRGLSTSLKLTGGGKSLEKWFKVIHRDTITIWGFHDPNDVLLKVASKEISELQQDLVEAEDGSMTRNIGFGAIPTVAGGLSVLIPPAAPVATPIAAGLLFAAWIYKAVSVTPSVLRGMMGYIVDLAIVMQSLFFLMQAHTEASGSPSPVNERLFRLALDAYRQDAEHSLRMVHNDIYSFATVKKAIFKSEKVIEKVEKLINDHRFKPSERFMEQARANTPN